MMKKIAFVSVGLLAVVLSACAASREAKSSAPNEPPTQSQQGPQAYPQQPGVAGQPAAPPPATDPTKDSSTAQKPNTSPSASSQYAPPPNRSMAMSQASTDIEASQRELDVAGGDCRNACRALGSMDRAAGRLCNLAQSNDEQKKCGDAKTRVYSARDKVRNTCGSCPEVSVDRNAPVPSRP